MLAVCLSQSPRPCILQSARASEAPHLGLLLCHRTHSSCYLHVNRAGSVFHCWTSSRMSGFFFILSLKYHKMFFHISWWKFMVDLDLVWVQLRILLQNSLQWCTRKTQFLGMSFDGLFQILLIISHCIYIHRPFFSQLLARSGIFCLLIEFVYYWSCGLKFIYLKINLAFLGTIV